MSENVMSVKDQPENVEFRIFLSARCQAGEEEGRRG